MTTRNKITACTTCGHATIYAPEFCVCGNTEREVVELSDLSARDRSKVEDEIAIEKTLAKFG